MRRALFVPLCIGLLASVAVGCAAAGDRVDGLRSAADDLPVDVDDVGDVGDVGDVPEDAGFCLALTRAAAAIESGSPATAEEATEEALARAPEEVVADVRVVAETVRKARDAGDWDPDDPELTAALERLTEASRQSCQPG